MSNNQRILKNLKSQLNPGHGHGTVMFNDNNVIKLEGDKQEITHRENIFEANENIQTVSNQKQLSVEVKVETYEDESMNQDVPSIVHPDPDSNIKEEFCTDITEINGECSADEVSSPIDHGNNTDFATASHDNPGMSPDSTYEATNDCPDSSSEHSSQALETNSRPHLRCVNCGLNVSRIRRHSLEILKVRRLIQHWVGPEQQQLSRNNLICHACWSAAWNEIRNPTNQTSRIMRQSNICISCGKSLLRIRSHLIRMDTPRENHVRSVIVHQIAPQQLPQFARICHTCWRRSDRQASPSVTSGDGDLNTTQTSITLPNYARAPDTARHCFVPGCKSSSRQTVPSALRASLFCDYNYYVPQNCRICSYHSRSNSWHLLELIENPIRTFSAEHVEEFAKLLKDRMLVHIDFENIANMAEHIVHYYLGITKDKFHQILSEVPNLANKHRGSLALAAYLMKLRTGDSDVRISALLQVPRSTLERLMKMARELLKQDLIPRCLGLNHISKEVIQQ